jgi:hypothetical protein
MFEIMRSLWWIGGSRFKSRERLEAENLALRHQLAGAVAPHSFIAGEPWSSSSLAMPNHSPSMSVVAQLSNNRHHIVTVLSATNA